VTVTIGVDIALMFLAVLIGVSTLTALAVHLIDETHHED
jgi:hypothetical protein